MISTRLSFDIISRLLRHMCYPNIYHTHRVLQNLACQSNSLPSHHLRHQIWMMPLNEQEQRFSWSLELNAFIQAHRKWPKHHYQLLNSELYISYMPLFVFIQIYSEEIAKDAPLMSCHMASQIIRNIKIPHYWPFVRDIHRWLANSAHKWPLIHRPFPCYDVIILLDCCNVTSHNGRKIRHYDQIKLQLFLTNRLVDTVSYSIVCRLIVGLMSE